MRISGQTGEIRWGYFNAATLGPWSIDGGVLHGTVVRSDAFRIAQQPLTLVVQTLGSPWRFSLREVSVDGAALTAIVQEESHESVRSS